MSLFWRLANVIWVSKYSPFQSIRINLLTTVLSNITDSSLWGIGTSLNVSCRSVFQASYPISCQLTQEPIWVVRKIFGTCLYVSCPIELKTFVSYHQTSPCLQCGPSCTPGYMALSPVLTKRQDMDEESWMRGQQTCPLTIHFNMWRVSPDVSIQRRHWQPLSVHLWTYCTHPVHDVNDVICVDWPQHRGLRPLLFSNSGVGSFTSHKNQISVNVVRRDLRF